MTSQPTKSIPLNEEELEALEWAVIHMQGIYVELLNRHNDKEEATMTFGEWRYITNWEGQRERWLAMGFTHVIVGIKTGNVHSRHRSHKAALRALTIPFQAYYRIERL